MNRRVSTYRERRLRFLLASQNPDGGWGYFPGKKSRLEPTAYALFALHGLPEADPVTRRAWALVRSWQLPGGAWRGAAQIPDPHWATSLCVTLCRLRHDEPALRRGLCWLLRLTGAENRWFTRLYHRLNPSVNSFDYSLQGWPWRPGNASWVEPTAHALVALKKAVDVAPSPTLHERVAVGERLLLDRRCSDGGWNSGTKKVLGEEAVGWPETTALALLGLQGARTPQVTQSLDVARRYWRESQAPLARAWLALTLRNHGDPLPAPTDSGEIGPDILLAALQALASPGGGHDLLRAGGSR